MELLNGLPEDNHSVLVCTYGMENYIHLNDVTHRLSHLFEKYGRGLSTINFLGKDTLIDAIRIASESVGNSDS